MAYVPSGSVVVGPGSQATTNAFTSTGLVIDLAQCASRGAVWVGEETGGLYQYNIKIQASLDQATWFDVNTTSYQTNGLTSSTTVHIVPVSGELAITIAPPWPGRYLQAVVQDVSNGNSAAATVLGWGY